MATQKPGGWVQSLITRFDSQVGIFVSYRRGQFLCENQVSVSHRHIFIHKINPSCLISSVLMDLI